MCSFSLQNHVRGIAIFNIVTLCICAIREFTVMAEDFNLHHGIIISIIKFVVCGFILAVYVLCLHGATTRNKCMLIPFIVLKSIEIIVLAGIIIFICIISRDFLRSLALASCLSLSCKEVGRS